MQNDRNDLISRREAIDAVEESRRLNHHTDRKAACDHENEHRHFLNILNGLPPADRWIPCSEIRPKHGVVLVTYNDGEIDLLRFPTAYRAKDIIAWMPRPEPYKGGKDV